MTVWGRGTVVVRIDGGYAKNRLGVIIDVSYIEERYRVLWLFDAANKPIFTRHGRHGVQTWVKYKSIWAGDKYTIDKFRELSHGHSSQSK